MKQQETVRLPVHSLIDLITNSSTEIFVNSKGSIEPAKELLTELLKLNGSDKTCDEVFTVSLVGDFDRIVDILNHEWDEYDEETPQKYGWNHKLDWSAREKIAREYVEKVEIGEESEPDYFKELSGGQSYISVSTIEPKYAPFLELLKTFLYSPNYYEHYD